MLRTEVLQHVPVIMDHSPVPEIAHAFGTLEPSNEGANAALQSIDCALGGLAQQYLQGIEHRFNWIEVRRILRQVSQFLLDRPRLPPPRRRPCGNPEARRLVERFEWCYTPKHGS